MAGANYAQPSRTHFKPCIWRLSRKDYHKVGGGDEKWTRARLYSRGLRKLKPTLVSKVNKDLKAVIRIAEDMLQIQN